MVLNSQCNDSVRLNRDLHILSVDRIMPLGIGLYFPDKLIIVRILGFRMCIYISQVSIAIVFGFKSNQNTSFYLGLGKTLMDLPTYSENDPVT